MDALTRRGGQDATGTVVFSQTRYTGYRLLSALTALVLAFVGVVLLATFLSNTMLPYGRQITLGPVETNYWGFYLMGFAGALLVTWAAFLAGAARSPLEARGVAAVTAFGLALNALFRAVAWFSGEFAETGQALRVEAGAMLVVAIAFLWLRPPPVEARVRREGSR